MSAAGHSSAPPVVVRDLTFGYEPGTPILQGISATLPFGQLCALVGPNAAGKSTLLKLMLGHLRPWSGQVELCGRDVSRRSAAERAALLSFVPQRAGAGFAFTVRQVVEMGRHALTRDAAAVDRAMRRCDLLGLRDRVFTCLSVGQQQRVLLARAMAQAAGQGRAMLLDEPGSAMDLLHVHQTMEHLVALARAGLGVLVVLHDLNLAARYADAVWLMDGGRLAAAGAWREVLRPEVLDPVYRVKLRQLAADGRDRPVFEVEGVGATL